MLDFLCRSKKKFRKKTILCKLLALSDLSAQQGQQKKKKQKVTLASTKELAGPALAAAAKALGTNTSYREMCAEAQKLAKTVKEIDAVATLWKTYTLHKAARPKSAIDKACQLLL